MSTVGGEWKTVIESPSGDQSGVLTVDPSGDSFTGTYSDGNESTAVENGKVDGNVLSWKMDISIPMTMTLECKATVDGNSMSGSAAAGAFGTFPLTGTRG